MRRFLIPLFSFLFLLIPSILFSNPTSRDSFIWNETTISRFIGKETEVVIPEGATAIGWFAFYGCSSLTSVVIPEGVKGIGDSAFRGCTSLTSVEIPENVKMFGAWSFYGCSSLTSVVIPESVRVIGLGAFGDCPKLTIHAPAGSYAEKYAKENNIPFKAK